LVIFPTCLRWALINFIGSGCGEFDYESQIRRVSWVAETAEFMERGLSEETLLSDDFIRQLVSVGEVDVLVGIASRNDCRTIGKVVRAAEESVLRNFSRQRTVLINIDAGSRDGTQQAVREASLLGANGFESLRTLRWITASVGSGNGESAELRAILAAADLLHAKAAAVVSASAATITPAWIDSLLAPIFRDNFDFVAPLYARHRFDGLLTRNLLYPFSRALFGKSMRELRATEFGFSGRLASECLNSAEWEHEGVQSSAETWMALTAMADSFTCCQTFLGPKPRSSSAAVVDVIREAVSGFFWCLESKEKNWLADRDPEPLKTIGQDHQLTSEAVRVDRKKMFQLYRTGVAELFDILSSILDADTHAELVRLAALDESAFRFSNALWVRTVYEFAAAYHRSIINRSHLVQALVPIYRGRVHSFLTVHRSDDPEAMEADLEDLCQEFVRQKSFFIERWSTKG
jgi:glucosylglycerate synthase